MIDASESLRFHFDSLDAAAEGLLAVLDDARSGTAEYRFGSLSAKQVLSSGLMLEGDITEVAAKLDKVPGAARSRA